MAEWYVTPSFNPSGDGSEGNPWDAMSDVTAAALSNAELSSGDTVFFYGGTFGDDLMRVESSEFDPRLTLDGLVSSAAYTSSNVINIKGSTGVLIQDFNLKDTGSTAQALIILFEDTSPAQQTSDVFINNCVFEGANKAIRTTDSTGKTVVTNCVGQAHKQTAFSFEQNNDDIFLARCTTFLNFNGTDGQAGDGFGFQMTGTVTAEDCISYNNSDDGFDSFSAVGGTVNANRCLTYGNGVDRWSVGGAFLGNGNGFKMGSSGNTTIWTMVACASHTNEAVGFDNNGSAAAHIIRNCSSIGNAGRGFEFGGNSNVTYVNCISWDNDVADTLGTTPTETTNSWNLSITDPQCLSDSDPRLDGDSPCLAVGTDWRTAGGPAVIGLDGLRFKNTPSIGAYEPSNRSGYARKGGAFVANTLGAGVDIAKAKAA